VPLPWVEDENDLDPWKPCTDWAEQDPSAAFRPILTHSFAYYFSLLSEIVNDTVFMFYAPRERFTSRLLSDFHERYLQWFTKLPEKLRIFANATPHVIALQ